MNLSEDVAAFVEKAKTRYGIAITGIDVVWTLANVIGDRHCTHTFKEAKIVGVTTQETK